MNREEIMEELLQSMQKMNTNSLLILLELLRTHPDVKSSTSEHK